MKNNFAKAMIVVPLALSVSFGIAACGQVNAPSAPVVQEQSINAETLKINTAATVDSLQNILLTSESVKQFQKFEKDASAVNVSEVDIFKNLDSDGKLWAQIAPLADFPTDDEGLKKFVFGDDSKDAPKEAVKIAQSTILTYLFMGFTGVSTEDLDLEKLNKFTYDYTSAEKAVDDRIKVKNQSMILKNDQGAIVDSIELMIGFKFNADGKKFYYDRGYFTKSEDIEKILNLRDDADEASKKIDEYLAENGKSNKNTSDGVIKFAEKLKLHQDSVLKVEFDDNDSSFKLTVTNKSNEKLKAHFDSKDGIIADTSSIGEDGLDLREPNVLLEASTALTELNPKNFDEDVKYLINIEEEVNESKDETAFIKIYKTAKISEDKKSFTVTVDGQNYKFAFVGK